MAHLTRPEWAVRPLRAGAIGPVDEVFVHHIGGRCAGEFGSCLRGWEDFHIGSRNMVNIAYSELVDDDTPTTADGRGFGRSGGHTLNWNTTAVAVCANGNYENQPATDGVVERIGNRIVSGIERGLILPNPRIRGHRDVFGTACPGRNLYARLPDIRDLVARGGSGTAPSEPLTPPTFDQQSGDLGMDGIFYGGAFSFFFVNDKGELWQRIETADGAPDWHGPLLADCAKGAEARVKVIDPTPEPRFDPYGFAVAAMAADGDHVRVTYFTGAPRNKWITK